MYGLCSHCLVEGGQPSTQNQIEMRTRRSGYRPAASTLRLHRDAFAVPTAHDDSDLEGCVSEALTHTSFRRSRRTKWIEAAIDDDYELIGDVSCSSVSSKIDRVDWEYSAIDDNNNNNNTFMSSGDNQKWSLDPESLLVLAISCGVNLMLEMSDNRGNTYSVIARLNAGDALVLPSHVRRLRSAKHQVVLMQGSGLALVVFGHQCDADRCKWTKK